MYPIRRKRQPYPANTEAVFRILNVRRIHFSVEVPFRVGDAIRVIDGPFADFTGIIEEINEEKKKVKVSVSIFGRPTPVELDFLQIEMEK